MEGYVYVMANAAFPGLLKIGRTSNTPQERAGELNSTGVPDRFIVIHSVFSKDCVSLEMKIHQYLSEKRYSKNREFFAITVEQAICAFENFSEDLDQSINDELSVCLYAYRLDGSYLSQDQKEVVNEIKESDNWNSDKLGLIDGVFRVGCIEATIHQIEGEGFTTLVPTYIYLDSLNFKNLLAQYYKELGIGVNVHKFNAFLLHRKLFTVRRTFFNLFQDNVSRIFQRNDSDVNSLDCQTYSATSEGVGVGLYPCFLNYDDLIWEFESEETQRSTEKRLSLIDGFCDSRARTAEKFRGKV